MAAPASFYNVLAGLETTQPLLLGAGTTVAGRALRDGANGVVNNVATIVALTAVLHADRVVVQDAAAPSAITLPAATGTGDVYTIVIDTAATATGHTILAAGSDKMYGVVVAATTTSNAVLGFLITTGATTITLNGTTKGGVKGDFFQFTDCKTNVWMLEATTAPTGSVTSPLT